MRATRERTNLTMNARGTALHVFRPRQRSITRSPIENAIVLNPKREGKVLPGRTNWYPYYAGFSHDFAQTLMRSLRLERGSRVLDPWNGSGTTTLSALRA